MYDYFGDYDVGPREVAAIVDAVAGALRHVS